MHGYGLLSSPAVVASFDLSRFHRLVGLGWRHRPPGPSRRANVTLACALQCSIYPWSRKSRASRWRNIRGGSPRSDRRRFFQDDLPEADLFAVSRSCTTVRRKDRLLLAKIHRACRPEALVDAESCCRTTNRPHVGRHAIAQHAGMPESRAELREYETLLRAAGFDSVEGHITGAPLDAVLRED